MAVPFPVAERRLELATALLPHAARLLRFERSRLHFSVGVSATDLKLPIHVEPAVAEMMGQAARQLALLLVKRHKQRVPTDDYDRILLSEEFGRLPDAPGTLAPASGGPEVRAAAELAPRLHGALPGGVLAAWLGPGGGGRSTVALLLTVLRRALAESKVPQGADHPLLASLLLAQVAAGAEAAVRSMKLAPAVDRMVVGATAAGYFLALRLAAQRACREMKASAEQTARVEAPLSPLLLAGRLMATGGAGSPYGCELTPPIPGLDEAVRRLAEGGVGAGRSAFQQILAADGDAGRRAPSAAAQTRLRELLLLAISFGERNVLPEETTAALYELLLEPTQVATLWADDKERKRFAKSLATEAKGLSDSPGAVLMELADAFKDYSAREPGASLGLQREQALADWVEAATAYAADLTLQRALAPARSSLLMRSGAELEGGVDAEYRGGRLYLLTLDDQPLVRPAEDAPVAHLFIDVKDFTRRTSLLGQAAMADFLRREFYLPILDAARARFGGMTHLSDRGGVSVNNLLGDAISMSGHIEALVGLAIDFKRHLVEYERRLLREVSSATVEQALRAIELEFQRKAAAPGVNPAKLAAEREAAIMRARGEGLEAGLFISFGPAPLVVTIDDDVFGRQRVAIADRINESARGTARSGAARAKVDSLLAEARAQRNDYNLRHPWEVFIGSPFSISIPISVEMQARSAAARGDLPGAMRALGPPVKESLEAAVRHGSGPEGDIYNSGAALSEEAMHAFQTALAGRRTFRALEVDPATLHPDIHRRYFLQPDPIRLVVGFLPDGRMAEVFRYAGQAHFKGFERKGGLAVWELLGESGIAALFSLHHGAKWLKA